MDNSPNRNDLPRGRPTLQVTASTPAAGVHPAIVQGNAAPPGTLERTQVTMPADPHAVAALAALDPLERMALRLIYERGMTQKEVAAALQLPSVLIGAAVARGLRRYSVMITTSARQGQPNT